MSTHPGNVLALCVDIVVCPLCCDSIRSIETDVKEKNLYPTYKLFIDDERYPPEGTFCVERTSGGAIWIMEVYGCPSFISFDHDLGGDDTAMCVVQWMIEKDLDNPGWIPDNFSFYVHSQNPIGKKNIEGLLCGYLNQR